MDRQRLRKQIAHNAARLLRDGRCDDPLDARHHAARSFVRGWTPAASMPSLAEILQCTAALSGSPAVALPEPYATYQGLLAPLAHVRMPKQTHPEGDALYHSLQTYVRVADAVPYDIELMLAGLLHEVGRSVDRQQPGPATLDLLDGLITERTAWLLAELPEEKRRLNGELGVRASRRLARHDDAETLSTLARCDRAAIMCGADVPELDDALAAIASLDDDVWDDVWSDENAG